MGSAANHWGLVSAFGLSGATIVGLGVWCLIEGGETGRFEMIVGGLLCLVGIFVLLIGVALQSLIRLVGAGKHAADEMSTRLRIATDNAGIGFWDRDLRTGELIWDEAMHRIYGTDPATHTPSSGAWANAVHPEDLEQTTELFTSAINGDADFETIYRILRPDGVVRSVRTTAKVIRDSGGSAYRVVGANWDVTDLAETERELRNTATRLSLAMQSARIGLWDVRLDPGDDSLESRHAICDEMLHRMLGYEPGELNSPNAGWHSICHPDDLAEMRACCRRSLGDDACTHRWDYRVRAKSGDWVWVHDAGEVVERDATGRATRMVGVWMLIDEQKRTEQALRSVVSLDGHRSDDGILTDMARSIAEAFDVSFVGIGQFVEVDGERYAEVIGGWHHGAPSPPMRYALRGSPCEVARTESYCFSPSRVQEAYPEDQEFKAMGAESYAGYVIRGADGDPIGVLAMVHDAPLRDDFDYAAALSVFAARAAMEMERSSLETTLRAAKEEAERASEFKSALVANVSHEIRTPLTAMIGYAELLNDGAHTRPATVMEFATTIARNGTQLLALVNDLLDSSKIDAGLMRVEHIEVRPGEIVSDVIGLLGPRADEKGLSFEIRCESPVPSAVVTDPARVRQILVNLIGNALKFTDAGRVVLSVSYDEHTRVLRFRVEDTGIGIGPEHLARLFKPFRQAEVSTNRRFGGTGLGLSISRDLAHLLGGEIGVESTPGVGSVFTVTLDAPPARDAALASPDAFFQECSGSRPRGSLLGPVRPALQETTVLLVDDSIDNRRLLSFHLGRAGAKVIEAADGAEALEKLGACDGIDLILTDLQMPVLDGYAFVERVRGAGISLPVIALTAHATREDEARCRTVGCDAYESKPIARDKLIDLCARLLGRNTGKEAA